MSDTSASFSELWRRDVDSISPEERLEMACSMFEFSRDLVANSIRSANSNISEMELQQGILLRFYGNDFDADTMERIARHLAGQT